MSTEYNTGLVVKDDGKGGIEVVKAFDDAITKLNKNIKQVNTEFSTLDKGFQSFAEMAKSIKPGIDDVNSSIKTLGESAKSTQEAVSGLGEGSEKANEGSGSLAKGFGSIISKASAVGNVISGVMGAFSSFADMLKHDAINEINTLSHSLDVSVDAFSKWSYAAGSIGVSTKDLGTIFKKTSNQIDKLAEKGGGKAKAMFDNLGLSFTELKALSPDEQLLAVAEGLDQLGSSSEKVKYLDTLYKDAGKLLPLLEDGAGGLRKMHREAELLGMSLNSAEASQVAAISDTFRVLDGVTEGVATQLTVRLAPAFSGISDWILNTIEKFGGIGNIVDVVVDGIITGVGFVLDIFHFKEILMTNIKLAWLKLAEIAIGTLAKSGDAVASLVNLALKPLTTILASVAEGWGFLAQIAGRFMGDAGKGLEDVGLGLEAFAEKTRNFTVDAEDIRAAEESIKNITAETAEELTRMKEAAPSEAFKEQMARAAESTSAQATATEALKTANTNAAASLDDLTKKTGEQTTAADNQKAATDKQKTAADGLKTSTDDVKTALDKEAESLGKNKEAKDKQAESTDKQKKKTVEYKNALNDVTDVLDKALTDNWLDLLQGNADGFFSSVKDGFKGLLEGYKDTLSEMAKEAIAKPIQMEFTAAMSEGGGGLSGFLDGSSFGTAFENVGGYISEAFGGSNLFEGAAGVSNLSYGVAGLAGGLFGSTAGGMGSLGGSLGSMAGMAIGGPLGAMVGSVLGSAVGSLFGGSWEGVANELQLNYSGSGGFSGQHYTKEKKKKLWKNRYRENYTALDAELANPLSAYFQSTEDSIRLGASLFGIEEVSRKSYRTVYDGEPIEDYERSDFGRGFSRQPTTEEVTTTQSLDDYLDNFTAKMTLDLKDLDENQVQKAIDNWAQSTTDDMMTSVFGDFLVEMQNQGESLSQTLSRVISQLEVVGSAFDTVNISLEELAGTSAQLQATYADDVLRAAGGENALSQLLSSYQSSYFTQEELLSKRLSDAASAMLGYSDAIGFEYGGDFRSQFEAAQASGLAADELVQWLRTGNMISQFEAIAEELAGVSEQNVDDVITNVLNRATAAPIDLATPETSEGGSLDKEADSADVVDSEDPVVNQVAALNEAIVDQVGGSNEHLASIDNRLVELNDSMTHTYDKLTNTVTDMLTNNDAAIKAMQVEIGKVARIVAETSMATADMIQDMTRLAIDLRPKGEPVIETEIL